MLGGDDRWEAKVFKVFRVFKIYKVYKVVGFQVTFHL